MEFTKEREDTIWSGMRIVVDLDVELWLQERAISIMTAFKNVL